MSRYIISDTKSGKKTLSIKNNENEREIRIHSAYDPVKEAERNIEGFNPGKGNIIIISGIGLGYHIGILKEKFTDTKILAVENDPEIIEICKIFHSSILDNVSIINTENDVTLLFDNLMMSDFKGVAHYIHRPSYMLNPEFYDNMIIYIKQNITSRISDLLTRFQFEERWVKNIFMNIRHFENSLPVSRLFGIFRNYPGIIVSAGPSLRKNLDKIKKIKDNALIVSVDTSYKVLHKSGISPHFVITLDAQKHSYKHFTGINDTGALLIADIVSCPAVLNTFPGKKLISSTSKYYQDMNGKNIRETTPVMDWVEKYITPPGDIQSGGSVATSAFDLLLNLGCDPIILIGQDLAYTGREYHCSGTYHNDDWQLMTGRFKNLDTINQNIIRKRSAKYVTKYGSKGTVISDFVFDLYKSWFEDSSAKVNTRVINATQGGAKIFNTEEFDLDEIPNIQTCKVSPSTIINKIVYQNNYADLSLLKNAVIKISNEIDKIINIDSGDTPFEIKIALLNDILDNDELNSIFLPFIRKTNFYTSRHSLNIDKTGKMLYDAVITSAVKLKRFINSTGWIDTN